MMKSIKPAKKRKGVYKFVLREDMLYKNTPIKVRVKNEWLEINDNGGIIVKGSCGDGYAWDGCSPKINVVDVFLLGIPDGRVIVNTGNPITYYASLVHDILYQFGKTNGIRRLAL